MTIRSGLMWRSLAAVAIGLLATSAGAKQPVDTGWTKITPGTLAVGADGKSHAPTCSGYPGTDPTFSFWTRKGTSKNLAVYFEGGGACRDNLTCTFPLNGSLPASIPQFFSPAIAAGTQPANYDGVFRADNPANPIKDWSIVYIPYCTGDLHVGSARKTYFNARGAVLPPPVAAALPPLPPAFAIEHRGFDNFMVVLDWMQKNIDKPKNVLVTGSSAGGYGASANFPWIERTFRNAHTYVLADASQGVTAPAFDTLGRTSWNMQLAPWVYGNDPTAIAGPDLLRVATAAHPHVKVAQFTTAFDGVQILFYDVMKSLYQYPGWSPNSAIDWNLQMLDTLQSYAADLPNFRYYLAAGSYHTLLRSPQFYLENSTGMPFSNWLTNMLANRGGTGGHGGQWFNASCAGCLDTPVAP